MMLLPLMLLLLAAADVAWVADAAVVAASVPGAAWVAVFAAVVVATAIDAIVR